MLPIRYDCIVLISIFVSSASSFHDINYVRSRRQSDSGGCVLPPHPEHGHWKLLTGEANPGETVPTASVAIFECDRGYKLSSKIPLVCLGKWYSSVPQCEVVCPPLYSSNIYEVTCTDKLGTNINCTEATHGSSLNYTCKIHYEIAPGYKETLSCENGKWDVLRPMCRPVCGKKVDNATQLSIYDKQLNKTIEYPWVAAIYQYLNMSFINICVGSILSQTVILTAAHCVANDYGEVLPKETFMIGVGKLYRTYGAPEDTNAQYFELSKIFIPTEYKGELKRFTADIAVLVVKGEITFNQVVGPVCFSNVRNIHLRTGDKGEVSGWGKANDKMPSNVLRSLIVPYKDNKTCNNELPSKWAHKYITKDKICAGYVNRSIAICSGDSGSGLSFPNREDGKYYVHGVASIAPHNNFDCDIQQNSLYTNVTSHYDFVDNVITRSGFESDDCILPPHPQNGKWTVEGEKWKPGDAAPSDTILKVECDEGYTLSSMKSTDCRWANELPTCEKFCPKPHISQAVRKKCLDKQKDSIYCSEATNGSILLYTCPSKHTTASGVFPKAVCVDGSWEPTPSCLRDCGKRVDDSGEGSDYPWNVAIYKLNKEMGTKEMYKYICGGSLVSEDVIVTAGQCVTDNDGNLLSKDDYLVAVGKRYRRYDDVRDTQAQLSNINYIQLNPEYTRTRGAVYNIALLQASIAFTFNNFIQPVCVTEIYGSEWLKPLKREMIGWRFGGESSADAVEALEVEYIATNDTCEIPSDFSSNMFLVGNKCFGFDNKTTCLFPEDQGKGIVAKDPENGRYYLQGVVAFYEDQYCQNRFWAVDINDYTDNIYYLSVRS